MSDITPKFGLPYLFPGQAQKDFYHNEALVRIDALMHAAVEGPPLAVPPADAESGQCWLVAADPEGSWSGRAGDLAVWTDGGWRFVAPAAGTSIWRKDLGCRIFFDGAGWTSLVPAAGLQVNGQKVVGERSADIASPSGGTIIDVEARAKLAEIIGALKSHGLIG